MTDQKRQQGDELLERHRRAAETTPLGPGTVGYTISGAAYRGKEIAGNLGVPGPAEPGFGDNFGLDYADVEEVSDYERAQKTQYQRPRD